MSDALASGEKARETVTVSPKDVRKIAFAAFVGTALEWYDYFLFGTAAALVFNHLFFTDLNPIAATMASFATFGVGFAARPIGAFIFGRLGDKIGRRPVLLLSIVLIGVSTGLVGLLPTYVSIGIAAPILLTLLRLFQGVAVGGEWGGATTLAIEHAPVKQRARYAAMVQIGSPVGTLMSAAAFALVLMLPPATVDAWGWRLPFLAAFPLLIVALFIRAKVEESPVFEKLLDEEQDEAQIGVAEIFKRYWKQLLIAIAAGLLSIGGFYVMTTFVISYAVNTLGVDRGAVVNATVWAALGEIVVIIVCGRVAEKIGAGKVISFGGILMALSAWPLFALIDTKNILAITIAITLGVGGLTITYSVMGVLVSELFPAKIRYTGVAVGANLSGAISGFLPFLISLLMSKQATPTSLPAILVLISISLITALAGVLGMKYRINDDVVVKTAQG